MSATLATALVGAGAQATTHEVRMPNRGEAGVMVFEPAFIEAAPGNTLRFIATDRGHNAQGIEGMLPEGAAAFISRPGDDFELTVTKEGIYGVKCTPHFAMGMVALIQVGAADNLDAALDVKHRGKAAGVFENLFAQVRQ
nr:pseudoazurin [Rhodovulum euryhalinum]